ncbi:MAG: thiopeptide-type bacteriocin biosynthesis protein [Bacteroidales bacterium]|jgi:thiopeptide-type bacteriocin biosynthesis protein|nr:thiopeptide-type bacteriocin biosynthesis protein [Bacteroidales bacterium]
MQRTFIIGDKWLYLKLYTGLKTADTLITALIGSLSSNFIDDNLAEKWFFLRYNDPQFHLRWRISITDPEKIGTIITRVNKAIVPYLDNDMIYKVQLDTYKREIERYGSNSIGIMEQLFWHNSMLVCDYLSQTKDSEDEKNRWLFSMRAIDSFLNLFNYELDQKLRLLSIMANSYGKEFNIDSALISQLSDRYRANKKDIFNFMSLTFDDANAYEALLKVQHQFNIRSTKGVNEILKLENDKQLAVSVDNLLISYIHMFMNRLFRSKQRLHEMVIYGFLFRYYRSQLAQSKHTNINA